MIQIIDYNSKTVSFTLLPSSCSGKIYGGIEALFCVVFIMLYIAVITFIYYIYGRNKYKLLIINYITCFKAKV